MHQNLTTYDFSNTLTATIDTLSGLARNLSIRSVSAERIIHS
jgi:hypothetical protein